MSRDTSRKEAAGIVLFFVAIAIILIFYLPVALTGIIGSAVKSFFLGLIGVAAYAIPVYILYVALDVFFEKRQGRHKSQEYYPPSGIRFSASGAHYHGHDPFRGPVPEYRRQDICAQGTLALVGVRR